jgi:hypothetical protein
MGNNDRIMFDRTLNIPLIENSTNYQYRWEKNVLDQINKTKRDGEVYTPNDIITRMNRIIIPLNNDEILYDISFKREQFMESCCGLAPFINNRFDQNTGQINPIKDRNGIFDLKMKQFDKLKTHKPYLFFSNIKTILKTLYAYEYDNEVLMLCRYTMRDSIKDYYEQYFSNFEITYYGKDYYKEIENIISWNFFNMDTTTNCIPNTTIPVYVMNWYTNQKILFTDLK